jgi:hypothetical protein
VQRKEFLESGGLGVRGWDGGVFGLTTLWWEFGWLLLSTGMYVRRGKGFCRCVVELGLAQNVGVFAPVL